jgi:hypothetical protein
MAGTGRILTARDYRHAGLDKLRDIKGQINSSQSLTHRFDIALAGR